MAFMGYETPVEMPSMGVYNTDLMKMYIAGVKDQYEKGREEMKDFMKLYGDFYSPIAGDTLRYNDMTVGGARDMINQMLASGIDPYKSPEARAAISRYINSVPTGVLNAMKQNAENRKAYDQAVAQARLSGKYDPEYEAWALKQAGLDNFSTVGPNGEIRVWDRLAPDPKQDWADIAAPYLKEFEKTELLDSDRPGYIKEGVSDENQKKGIDAVMNAAGSTPWMLYKLLQAYDRTPLIDENGDLLSDERRRDLAAQDVRRQVENTAAQYYQPQYKDDWKYKSDYETANNIRQYWATTGANPGPTSRRTSGSDGPGGTGYLAIHDAVTRGIASKIQTSFGDIDYSSYQSAMMKNGNHKPYDVLTKMSFDVSPTLFAGFMKRTPLGGSSNVVAYETGDAGTLYSASEVYSRMYGRPGGFKPTKYGNNARKHMSNAYLKDPLNGVTRNAKGKGVGVLEDDGLVHVYLIERDRSVRKTDDEKNQVSTDVMFMDTGYRYDPETWEVDENRSINAIARDAAATKSAYGQQLYKLKN